MEHEITIDTGGIKGVAVVRIPEPDELVEIQKSVKFKTKLVPDEKGGQKTVIDLGDSDAIIEMTTKMQMIGLKHIVKVDAKHSKGVVFSDAKSLSYYKAGREILQKAGEIVMNGVELGED
jgi:hypothetical protein